MADSQVTLKRREDNKRFSNRDSWFCFRCGLEYFYSDPIIINYLTICTDCATVAEKQQNLENNEE